MYSYRKFIDKQNERFMSSDEKLEKKNLEILRHCIAENSKANRQEFMQPDPQAIEPDVKYTK